jgi:hypothetical protein
MSAFQSQSGGKQTCRRGGATAGGRSGRHVAKQMIIRHAHVLELRFAVVHEAASAFGGNADMKRTCLVYARYLAQSGYGPYIRFCSAVQKIFVAQELI